MTRESCRAVGICGSRSGKKDSGSLFAPAISLALHVDNGDDGPLNRVLIVLDHFANACSEGNSLFQSYFPMPRTGKATVWVWNNAEESCVLVAERCFPCKHRFIVTMHRCRPPSKRVDPPR